MLNWMKRRSGGGHSEAESDAEAPKPQRSVMSGQYLALYRYLANRYADTVVLTFEEIEDLLGFTLPDPARLRQDWWTNTEPTPAPGGHADAWILANRTARPNLLARTVVFERLS